jgi:hypothetical protein
MRPMPLSAAALSPIALVAVSGWRARATPGETLTVAAVVAAGLPGRGSGGHVPGRRESRARALSNGIMAAPVE